MMADVARGDFIDPNASRTTFQEFAEKWLASQSGDPNTRASMESQLKPHAVPRIGSRQLGSFQPSHIREFVTQLEASGMSGAYARVIFSNVRAALRRRGGRMPAPEPLQLPHGDHAGHGRPPCRPLKP